MKNKLREGIEKITENCSESDLTDQILKLFEESCGFLVRMTSLTTPSATYPGVQERI